MQQLQVTYRKVSELIPYANNARKHSDEQVTKIASSIKEFGFTNPILLDGKSGIIAGHGRLMAAKKLGIEDVPTIDLHGMSAAQKKAYIIADNKLALDADWDIELLQLEIEALKELDFDVSLTGFDENEITKIEDKKKTDDSDGEVSDNVETRCVQGDVWALGNHRLICGDSTLVATYDALLGGDRCQMMLTDPPYNVDYVGKSKSNSLNLEKIKNDALGDSFQQFLLDFFSASMPFVDGGVYVFMSSTELAQLKGTFETAGGHFSTFIIWAKDTFTLGRSDYHQQYEPCLYGWRDGTKRVWNGDRDKSNLIEFERYKKNELHPTMKPVGLFEILIKNSSNLEGIVLDPFAGSGTTIIACENIGRKARCVELNPKFCDVILHRWENLTGKTAKRVSGQNC